MASDELTFDQRGRSLCRTCFAKHTVTLSTYVQRRGGGGRVTFRRCRCGDELTPNPETSESETALAIPERLSWIDSVKLPDDITGGLPAFFAGEQYWCAGCRTRFRVRSAVELFLLLGITLFNALGLILYGPSRHEIEPAWVQLLFCSLWVMFVGLPIVALARDVWRRLRFRKVRQEFT